MGVVVRKSGTGEVMQKTRVARRSGRTRVFTHAVERSTKRPSDFAVLFLGKNSTKYDEIIQILKIFKKI